MGKVGEGGRGFMAQVLGCDSMGTPDTGGRVSGDDSRYPLGHKLLVRRSPSFLVWNN